MKNFRLFTKIALMVALIVGVCSCSDEKEDAAPSYDSLIMGTWDYSRNDQMIFESDGTVKYIYKGDVEDNDDKYTITGDILFVEFGEANEYVDGDDGVYNFIYELNDEYIILARFGAKEDGIYYDSEGETNEAAIMATTREDVAKLEKLVFTRAK